MNTNSTDPSSKPSEQIESELQSKPKEEPIQGIESSTLHRDAELRAKQNRPLLQKIVRAIRRDDSPYREIIINSEPLEKRVAVLDNGVLEKFDLERLGDDRLVGAIFKGKIQNLEAGLKAAFVDIGLQKNAFLHYWDILPAVADSMVEFVRDTRSEEQRRKGDKVQLKDIPSLYPVGSDIVVQITKSTIGTKGPRVTTNLSLAGRYIVLMPYAGQCGISKKIEDDRERIRLKEILRKLAVPEGMGIIIRTAGEGKRWAYFVRDLAMLLETWNEIRAKMEASREPTCLYQEPDITERTVRDFLTENIDRVLVDSVEDHKKIEDLVGRISKRSRSKIVVYKDNIPIFERFNIERQIEQTYQRRVPLPSGGEIVIEETEALTAVDVNTGAHKTKEGDTGSFIVQVNLEAASEIARQIRLRNIGGLIILDFIDMKNPRDRRSVYNRMRDEMDKDKAKNHILPISTLGIMQMTRQRHKESVASGLYTGCPYCSGRGIVKSPRTMSVEIQRRLVSVIRRLRARPGNAEKILHLRIYCHPHALERLRHEDEKLLVDIEDLYKVKLAFRADPIYHVENFKILDGETNQELR
ncbi:MAG: Rne/Rng family ribonuclease [Verrucomicrobiota bacterium]|nr:Rne/Rng family ribonuclease [Verrucomicrobiota bacterium]